MNADRLKARFPDPIKVLDHGYVRLVTCMGDDALIADAARVSYQGLDAQRDRAEDRRLLRYLMRHRHTSPFEQAVITFGLKMPIYVARQHVRHRTARLNEVSGRYREMPDEVHLPGADEWREQSTTNKQGSGGAHELRTVLTDEAQDAMARAREAYQWMIDNDVAKEQARLVLPVAQYTEMYWQIDLHNLLHYLSLRLDSHAQAEIRAYAEAMATIVQAWCPLAWEAFEDYHPLRCGQLLSRHEGAVILALLGGDARAAMDAWDEMTKREQDELRAWVDGFELSKGALEVIANV